MGRPDDQLYFDPNLTVPDRLVLASLAADYDKHKCNGQDKSRDLAAVTNGHSVPPLKDSTVAADDVQTIETLKAFNDPSNEKFTPTFFVSMDLPDLRRRVPPIVDSWVIQPYIKWARTVVRVETDVVMLTHLFLYFTTSVPSALYLFYNFHWWHAIPHAVMTGWYIGTYTLMMHQHIHMRGILAKQYSWLDSTFPYITDPLMGHTWNSYFFHHVKHHHIEGNGPEDLSSTIRYQRDDIWNFLQYVGRFYFFVWFDLPKYFIGKRRYTLAAQAFLSEGANYVAIYFLAAYVSFPATFFVFIIPLMALRVGLMVGNWGQHAFVDEVDPTSDFRSSITLIDVASNRFCYNDGYHTSHHLNPLRHWRDHPVSFVAQKQQYADEHALVFHDIDFIMITISLLRKDYMHLARCLVPMGSQMSMTLEERAEMLRTKTRAFSEDEVNAKYGLKPNGQASGKKNKL